MTVFFIGLMVLRLLLTAIFFIGLYKIFALIRRKIRSSEGFRENRGIIILKERLASGEIDEVKYREMAETIKS